MERAESVLGEGTTFSIWLPPRVDAARVPATRRLGGAAAKTQGPAATVATGP